MLLAKHGLFAEGSRQGHFFGFAFFTADFLAPFFAPSSEQFAVEGPWLQKALESTSRRKDDPAKDPLVATVRLRKRAFACGLFRCEGSRLTFGVGDRAAAAGKPDDAGGEDEGEEHYGCCEAESDTLDEVAVGNCKDRLLRGRVEMFDRPAGPDLGRVSAGIRVSDDHIGDFPALGRIRKRVGEVGAEGGR